MVVIAFIAGLAHLFMLRFERGDFYPAYSTLRSDPLGTRALYKSAENLNVFNVKRNYLPLNQVTFNHHTSFFYLGVHASDNESIPEYISNAFDDLTDKNGRLIISFYPSWEKFSGKEQNTETGEESKEGGNHESDQLPDQPPDQSPEQSTDQSQKQSPDQSPEQSPKQSPKQSNDKKNEPDGLENRTQDSNDNVNEKNDQGHSDTDHLDYKSVSLKEHWGVVTDYAEDPELINRAQLAIDYNPWEMPRSISWHSTLYFTDLTDEWRVVYTCNKRPVIIERPFQNGSIILSADSYYLSNEALWAERHPGLLAWIMGTNNELVFDEAHLGINQTQGVAGLIRKHDLHWFFFGIAILGLMFVWRNSAHFIPPPSDDQIFEGDKTMSKRDSLQGLISLLRRNIPAGDILKICIEQWKETLNFNKTQRRAELEHILRNIDKEKYLFDRKTDPVKGYQSICSLISTSRKE